MKLFLLCFFSFYFRENMLSSEIENDILSKEDFTVKIRYDCHLHSNFSGDCDTPAERMIEKAVSLGMEGICFTEHLDIDAPGDPEFFLLDTDRYFSALLELREKWKNKLRVRIGVELGVQRHLLPDLTRYAASYPFDFIICSQHYVDGGDPYDPSYFEGRSERECYERFFQVEYESLCHFSSFDTLGHMDYVVRYGPNKNRNYSYEKYREYLDPILRLLIQNGKCLEVNTGGLKHGLGEPNPCIGILKRYRELGGELITIGSDAHIPNHLAYAFPKAASLLRELGYRYYCVFQDRKPEQLPL